VDISSTAAFWRASSSFDREATFRRALNEFPQVGRKAILYPHVPFCRTHCWYCFYNIKVPKKTDLAIRAYLDALTRQMAFYASPAYVKSLGPRRRVYRHPSPVDR
jgi:coproporphyrinogen III oxidase-like Fe-S oxidoreductase